MDFEPGLETGLVRLDILLARIGLSHGESLSIALDDEIPAERRSHRPGPTFGAHRYLKIGGIELQAGLDAEDGPYGTFPDNLHSGSAVSTCPYRGCGQTEVGY